MTNQTSPNKSRSCIVAGHLCLDVIPTLIGTGNFASTFLPGRLLEAGPVLMATGGAVSNTGQALHKLGIDTRLMGKIGDDMFGQAILRLIEGVEARLAADTHIVPGEASSYTIILSPPNTDRIFLHCPGANDTFGADDIDYDALREADLFHFGYPPLMKRMYEHNGIELAALFQQAKATGITTSLDLAMPDPTAPSGQANWPAILETTLPYVDIFTPSIEEILLTLQPQQFHRLNAEAKAAHQDLLAVISPTLLSDIGQKLLDLGAKIVLIKASHLGLYLRTADEKRLAEMGRAKPIVMTTWAKRELWAPIFETAVTGTTGAGDASIAGFLAALLQDLPPEEAVTMGNAVGACNVEAADATSGVRSWAETLARIEAGWTRRSLQITTPGWRFDETQQVWLGPSDVKRRM